MEKISGIVKASPRLTSVDLRDAPPVRPGTPGFGRPQGVSSLAVKSEPPTFGRAAEKGASIQAEMMDWRTKDSQRAAMAAELSERFFIKNRAEAEPPMVREEPMAMMPISTREVASRPAGFKQGDMVTSNSLRADTFADDVDASEAIELQQPEGLYPKGSFLDRTA